MKQFLVSKKGKQFSTYCLTDVGLKRTSNEDSFWIDLSYNLFIVVDGMGGHNAGEIASKMAIELLKTEFDRESLQKMKNDDDRIEAFFNNAINNTSKNIFDFGNNNREWNGMGCTVAIAWLSGNVLFSGHVGDTRIYVCNKKEIKQIGHDHSHVSEVVQLGRMTKEEARMSPLKNQITQALGMTGMTTPEFHKTKIVPGDRVLLCSDGLWDMLPDHEIQKIASSGNNAKSICEELVGKANLAGGDDNITVLVSIYK
jgi:PPM family protein phosphatase